MPAFTGSAERLPSVGRPEMLGYAPTIGVDANSMMQAARPRGLGLDRTGPGKPVAMSALVMPLAAAQSDMRWLMEPFMVDIGK